MSSDNRANSKLSSIIQVLDGRAPARSVRTTVAIALSFVVMAAAFLAYYPALENGFTNWDDNWLVTENRWIRSFSAENLGYVLDPWAPQDIREELGNEYLPVRDLTYMVNYAISGLDPFGWHLTDILLHAFNAALVLWLAARLSRSWLAGAFAGLIFATMPIHVEAVAWVSCRKDLLAALFVLLSTHCYLNVRLRPRRHLSPAASPPPPPAAYAVEPPKRVALWVALGLLCFLLALFSKVPAIALPGIVVAFELLLGPNLHPLSRARRAALCAGYTAVGITVYALIAYPIAANGLVREPFGGSWASNTQTALGGLIEYFGSGSLLTSGQARPVVDASLLGAQDTASLFGGVSSITLIGGLLILIALAGALTASLIGAWKRRNKPLETGLYADSRRDMAWLLAAVAWLLIAFIPVCNLFVVTGTVYADRYAYLPSVGAAMLLAFLTAVFVPEIVRGLGSRVLSSPLTYAAAALLLSLQVVSATARSIEASRDWHSSETLWNAVLERDPQNHIALFNRSRTRQEQAGLAKSPGTKRDLLMLAKTDMQAALDNPARTYRYDPARCHGGLAKIEMDFAVIERDEATVLSREARKHRGEAESFRLRAASSRNIFDQRSLIEKQEENEREADAIGRKQAQHEQQAEAHLTAALQHLTAARKPENFGQPWRIPRDRDYLTAELLNYEGLIASQRGNDAAAESLFERSSKVSRRAPAARINLAMLVAKRAEELARLKGYSEVSASLFTQAFAHLDAYEQSRRFPDVQSLTARAKVLAKQAEAIEGPDAVTQPEAAADLYRRSAEYFANASELLKEAGTVRAEERRDVETQRAEVIGRRSGNDQEALDAARRAAEIDKALEAANPVNRLKQARLLLTMKRTKEARELLEAVVKEAPNFEPARQELAALNIGYAQAAMEELRARWIPEFDAMRKQKNLSTEKPPEDFLLLAAFDNRPEFQRDLAPAARAFEEALKFGAKGSAPHRRAAEWLTTTGQAKFQLGDKSAAEALLRRSFSYDEELKLTQELLGQIYFERLEELVQKTTVAEQAGQPELAKDAITETWEMIRNLVLLSPRAAAAFAAKITRQARAAQVPIDERYVEKVEGGFDLTGQKVLKEIVPPEKRADYTREMQPILRAYEWARTLDPEQPDAISLMNDYFSRTGQFKESLAAYRKLETRFEKRPKDLMEVRKSIGSMLLEWGLSLDRQYRSIIKVEKPTEEQLTEARKLRTEAISVLREAATAWDKVIEGSSVQPEYRILSSAGVLRQKLAVLDLKGARDYLLRASEIYALRPENFRGEQAKVFTLLSIHDKDQTAKLRWLRSALDHTDDVEKQEDLRLRIQALETRKSIPEAQGALEARRYAEAIKTLDDNNQTHDEAQRIRAQAYEGLGENREAAAAWYTCDADARAQFRAGELMVALNDDSLLGKANTAYERAEELYMAEMIAGELSGDAVDSARQLLARIREARASLLDRSASLVDQAREMRAKDERPDKRMELLRQALRIAVGNYEALHGMAIELRLLAKVRLKEADLRREKNDTVGVAEKLKLAAQELDEACQFLLAAVRQQAPLKIQYRLEYAGVQLRELWPIVEGERKTGALRVAARMLDDAASEIDERERDGGTDMVRRWRVQLVELRDLLEKLGYKEDSGE